MPQLTSPSRFSITGSRLRSYNMPTELCDMWLLPAVGAGAALAPHYKPCYHHGFVPRSPEGSGFHIQPVCGKPGLEAQGCRYGGAAFYGLIMDFQEKLKSSSVRGQPTGPLLDVRTFLFDSARTYMCSCSVVCLFFSLDGADAGGKRNNRRASEA